MCKYNTIILLSQLTMYLKSISYIKYQNLFRMKHIIHRQLYKNSKLSNE